LIYDNCSEKIKCQVRQPNVNSIKKKRVENIETSGRTARRVVDRVVEKADDGLQIVGLETALHRRTQTLRNSLDTKI
jgi:hypothetical protein